MKWIWKKKAKTLLAKKNANEKTRKYIVFYKKQPKYTHNLKNVMVEDNLKQVQILS
jgi:hypothetical protein